MIRKCNGCGYTLQCKSKDELGYVPREKLEDAIYCERCFKIIHYNDSSVVSSSIDTEKIITKVNMQKGFVFFLIEFLNLNEETIHTFLEIKNPKVLVISKCDVIPKSIKPLRLEAWIRKTYHIVDDILFVSGLHKKNISKIYQYVLDKKKSVCYFLGYTNSGKSTLLNAIYEQMLSEKSLITTSPIPNTTLDFIQVSILPNFTIIDSPGFLLKKNFYEDWELDLLRRILPKKFLKPVIYQTKKGMQVTIENRMAIEVLSEEKNSMTFYMSNEVCLEKSFGKEIHIDGALTKRMHLPADFDLVIRGVGFLHIKKECDLEITSVYLPLLEIRKSLFAEEVF